MLPGMGNVNPRQMQNLMKQMGIKSREINAEEVVIKTDSGRLIITNPQVTEITMQGIKTYQIVGEIKEEVEEFKEDDVKLVMEKVNCSKDEAEQALKDANGEVAAAIIALQEKMH
ncbi:MAG: nascent polypeptide-associated complex protein [Candidatus Diapherotrites archaeon]|nr:nascent polypeptide-associated complex protein [Candidatus Diapherotrites archaeon]